MLRYTADRRALAHLALGLGAYALALFHSLWWLGAAIPIGVHCVAVQHNHTHLPLFVSRHANRVLDLWLLVLTAMPMASWRVHHLRGHHRVTPDDPDWSSPQAYRRGRQARDRVGFRYYQFTYAALLLADAFGFILRQRNRRLLGSLLVDVACFAAAHIALVLRVGAGRWAAVAVPAYAVAWLGLGASVYLQHLTATWTFTCRIHNWLAYNLGYHLLHHLRPNVHWSRLRCEHERDPSYAGAIEHGLYPGLRGPWGAARWVTAVERGGLS